MNAKRILNVLWTLSFVVACGVESNEEPSGGVDLGGEGGEGGEGGQGSSEEQTRGFAVLGSDYASTNVSLLSSDGEVQSASFISSGSKSPGLSAALGGDVVLPSMAVPGDELVLIDRFPASVLTWVDLRTAEVRAQLSVATGFAANPQDYVPYSETKAYVPRYEPNLASGEEEFDEGNDVLIVDPSTPAIIGRIDLAPAFDELPEGFYPRGSRALLASGKLRVLAVGLNADYTDRLASRLITIDPETDAIEDVLVFDGMHSCGSAVLSPDGKELAVPCAGAFGQDPLDGFPDSGVVIVDVSGAPREVLRYTSDELGIDQVNEVAWIGDDHVVVLTSGRFGPDQVEAEANDQARTMNVRDGSLSDPWLSSGPFTLGDVACSLTKSKCLLADAGTDGGVVHTLSIRAPGEITITGELKPETASGLPPRGVGTY